jgi:hypothetical protein
MLHAGALVALNSLPSPAVKTEAAAVNPANKRFHCVANIDINWRNHNQNHNEPPQQQSMV